MSLAVSQYNFILKTITIYRLWSGLTHRLLVAQTGITSSPSTFALPRFAAVYLRRVNLDFPCLFPNGHALPHTTKCRLWSFTFFVRSSQDANASVDWGSHYGLTAMKPLYLQCSWWVSATSMPRKLARVAKCRPHPGSIESRNLKTCCASFGSRCRTQQAGLRILLKNVLIFNYLKVGVQVEESLQQLELGQAEARAQYSTQITHLVMGPLALEPLSAASWNALEENWIRMEELMLQPALW